MNQPTLQMLALLDQSLGRRFSPLLYKLNELITLTMAPVETTISRKLIYMLNTFSRGNGGFYPPETVAEYRNEYV